MPTTEQQYQYALEENRARQRLSAEEDLARQQQEQQEKGVEANKMSWLLFMPAIILSIIADVVEILTAGTLGWFVGLFVDIILLFMLGLSRSGRKQFKKWLVMLAGESIPFVAFLPLRTIGIIWSFMSSRPKMLAVVQKGLSIASKIPSPISAELKGVSKAVDIGARVQQMQQSGASTGNQLSALASNYKSLKNIRG